MYVDPFLECTCNSLCIVNQNRERPLYLHPHFFTTPIKQAPPIKQLPPMHKSQLPHYSTPLLAVVHSANAQEPHLV